MNEKIRIVKKQSEPPKPKQGTSTNDYLKSRLSKDVSNINKVIEKLEKSIQNHNNELEDKKKALEACKTEKKELEMLQKQLPF
jgi:flagellar biosynthesis chaperone FliJ